MKATTKYMIHILNRRVNTLQEAQYLKDKLSELGIHCQIEEREYV